MFKQLAIALVMLATLAVGGFGITPSAEAQRLRGGWYTGRPAYSSYYGPPVYNYYYGPRYARRYAAPYGYYYYDPPYGVAPYYTARPGVQVYFR